MNCASLKERAGNVRERFDFIVGKRLWVFDNIMCVLKTDYYQIRTLHTVTVPINNNIVIVSRPYAFGSSYAGTRLTIYRLPYPETHYRPPRMPNGSI